MSILNGYSIITIIIRTFDNDTDYYVTAAEVEAIEKNILLNRKQ
jgi:hypothetical protein